MGIPLFYGAAGRNCTCTSEDSRPSSDRVCCFATAARWWARLESNQHVSRRPVLSGMRLPFTPRALKWRKAGESNSVVREHPLFSRQLDAIVHAFRKRIAREGYKIENENRAPSELIASRSDNSSVLIGGTIEVGRSRSR